MEDNSFTDKTVICFGEVLWDNLPSGRLAGGAPMNVAYHLRKLGIDASVVSRVGNDLPGKELLSLLSAIGIPTNNIQTDLTHATSEVIAEEKANNEMVYTINYPVAWDFIELDASIKVADADAFVFGSLAARNEVTKKTLLTLLEQSKFNVFDVNLRAPHYTKTTISELLGKADLLKLNENEIVFLGDWFTAHRAEAAIAQSLMEQFHIAEILITKAADGGTYYGQSQTLSYTAQQVKVVDTVGSGDSFLAAFLSRKLMGEELESSLHFASKLAGFVTSQKGACPNYDIDKVVAKS
jgi:fructokinase